MEAKDTLFINYTLLATKELLTKELLENEPLGFDKSKPRFMFHIFIKDRLLPDIETSLGKLSPEVELANEFYKNK